jgi:hypothetical protein
MDETKDKFVQNRPGRRFDAQDPSAPKASGRPILKPWVRLAGVSVGILLVIGLAALGAWLISTFKSTPTPAETNGPANSNVSTSYQRPVVPAAGLTERSGVQIVQVAVTGGGGLIDLRYQVVDPDKANALHDEATPPVIIDESTGLVVDQLLMGHSHTGSYQAGSTYYLVFENPGNLVQSGAKVSVLLGNAEVDHVAVQ